VYQKRRQRELLEWAKLDYGIDAQSLTDSKSTRFGSRTSSNFMNKMSMTNQKLGSRKFTIKDETDFIHKIRNRYILKKNNETAIFIQKNMKAALTRAWYKKYRGASVKAITSCQSILRMIWQRRKFRQILAIHYYRASLLI